MAGTLYIVATPIGNLEDITLRAIRVLKEADIILAEDTRQNNILLNHYQIEKPVLSYHQHSDETKKMQILAELLSGKNLALVSDAGTPGISDPGNELIDFLLEKEPTIKIIPIPGASAITTALSVSGFRADKFIFLGFLPKKKKNKLFEWLKNAQMTFAFYESPYRLLKTLSELKERFASEAKPRNDRSSGRVRIEPGSREVRSGGGGGRRIFIARELTKLHETLYRGKIEDVLERVKISGTKGEIVVVIEGVK